MAAALARLRALGIVRETTGKRYGRQLVYGAQLDLLDRGPGATDAPSGADGMPTDDVGDRRGL